MLEVLKLLWRLAVKAESYKKLQVFDKLFKYISCLSYSCYFLNRLRDIFFKENSLKEEIMLRTGRRGLKLQSVTHMLNRVNPRSTSVSICLREKR